MVAPPDDLTSWRPDDGDYEEYVEICKFYEILGRISEPDYPLTKQMVAAIANNEASHRQWAHWCRRPRPLRDMLLQRYRAPRPAHRQRRWDRI